MPPSLLYLMLAILGAMFGSFASVLIWRWKHDISGITTGRSVCPHCHTPLKPRDMIPIVSFVLQGGKCRHCQNKISWFYPLIEAIMAGVFCCMGYIAFRWGIEPFSVTMLILLIWGFITVTYAVYDALYTEVPDKIFVFGFFILFILFILGYFFNIYEGFPEIQFFHTFHTYIKDHLLAAWILYTFVFLLIFIPSGMHLMGQHRYSDFFMLTSQYILFPLLVCWSVMQKGIGNNTHKTNQESDTEEETLPMWMGPGDLLIVLFIGLTIGLLHGVASFLFACIFGSIFGIVMLIRANIRNTPFSHEIAFGPFLALGWMCSLLGYEEIRELWEFYTLTPSFL